MTEGSEALKAVSKLSWCRNDAESDILAQLSTNFAVSLVDFALFSSKSRVVLPLYAPKPQPQTHFGKVVPPGLPTNLNIADTDALVIGAPLFCTTIHIE